ncbi:MAG TPA: hypothetical protein P5555_00035 [Candidatus Paceibacterota bacterium]|nr:hypothetical protein [Verrucomicrobiota bacterium]HRZ43561.1 hypothetical protein [Candidatus Paceibacterota bacterium]
MILLSLASKQIWPQVLAVAQLKPERVVLLHSGDPDESKNPAQRLKRFFDESGLAAKGATRLEQIPDDDFAAIERQLDELQSGRQWPLAECAVHFTGGNKLMATAAFRWAAKRGVKAFYLDRHYQLTWFEPRDGEMHTHAETLDGHLTDRLDPVALLRCQVDASEVQRSGQVLTLSEAGRKISDSDFFRRIGNGQDARTWLRLVGEADRESKEGDSLEFSTAAVLLKLGVYRVQRSLRLKVKSSSSTGTRLPHAEIDLLFAWGGRLWLVDCKDRKPKEELALALRRCLPHSILPEAEKLLGRIQEELSIGETKAMKEDLLASREAGGLLGNVVCVWKAELPEEVQEYARQNQIQVVRKSEMVSGLRDLLFPERPADSGDIASLKAHFRK